MNQWQYRHEDELWFVADRAKDPVGICVLVGDANIEPRFYVSLCTRLNDVKAEPTSVVLERAKK